MSMIARGQSQAAGILGFGGCLYYQATNPTSLIQPPNLQTLSSVAHFAHDNGYHELGASLLGATTSKNYSVMASSLDDFRGVIEEDDAFYQDFVAFLQPEDILMDQTMMGAAVLHGAIQAAPASVFQNMAMSLALFPDIAPPQVDAVPAESIQHVLNYLNEVHSIGLLSIKADQQVYQDDDATTLALYKWLIIIDEYFNGVGNPQLLDDLQMLGAHFYHCDQSKIAVAYYEQLVELMMQGAYGIDVEMLSDHYVAAVLGKYKGSRPKAAFELGTSKVYVFKRIINAASDSPLAPFKTIKGKLGNYTETDADIAEALEKHGGNRVRAAAELGIHDSTVCTRIKTASPDSPLAPFKTIRGQPGRNPKKTDADIAEALKKHEGNRVKAAIELGIDTTAVRRRINCAAPDSPLTVFKNIKSKSLGRNLKKTDADIAKALKKHEGNRVRVAAELGIHYRTVCTRIKRASPDSPLAPFKTIKGQPGPSQKKTDAEIAEALEKHGGDQTKAATELKMSQQRVSIRVIEAIPGSPLERFK